MNIPNFIIESGCNLPIEDRGLFFSAVIYYMNDGVEPDFIHGVSLAAFSLAKKELDRVLRRRKRDAARRFRKKQEKLAMQNVIESSCQPAVIPVIPDEEPSLPNPVPYTPPLTRRQRRWLMRKGLYNGAKPQLTGRYARL